MTLTNQSRAENGLPGYANADDLAQVALGQAERMAAEGRIYHNPNLGTEVGNWQRVGENVGRGQSADSLHEAFMNSPTHRENLLSSGFAEIGVGTAFGADGRLYVAEVFRLPAGAEAAPAPAPAPDPEPAPAPAAAPAAEPTPAAPVAVPEPVTPAPEASATPTAVAASAPAPTSPPHVVASQQARAVQQAFADANDSAFAPQAVSSVHPGRVAGQDVSSLAWIAGILAIATLTAHALVINRQVRDRQVAGR